MTSKISAKQYSFRLLAASYGRRCQIQELLWGKNPNALEGVKNKQICIAGNEVSCLTTHRNLEKLIILGIAAGSYLHFHFNPLRLMRNSRYETASVLYVDVPAKLFTMQNIVEFRERRK